MQLAIEPYSRINLTTSSYDNSFYTSFWSTDTPLSYRNVLGRRTSSLKRCPVGFCSVRYCETNDTRAGPLARCMRRSVHNNVAQRRQVRLRHPSRVVCTPLASRARTPWSGLWGDVALRPWRPWRPWSGPWGVVVVRPACELRRQCGRAAIRAARWLHPPAWR